MLAVLAVVAVGGALGIFLLRPGTSRAADWMVAASPSASAAPSPSPSPSPSTDVPASFPTSGPGTWTYATGTGAVLGTKGPVKRYHVAVESNVSYPAADFAAKVDQTLGDPRSWIAAGTYRLQRVPEDTRAEFTVYLATRDTSTHMCAQGWVDTDGYTSCRTSGHVIINLDRWYLSVPDYVNAGVPLDAYRTYVINHETGHQLGHGHELCPGPGKPAPVMEQQTLGLHGCIAYGWPYLNGKRYAGPSGHY